MTVRHLREHDIPILKAMAEASGFPYAELRNPLMEAVMVVADEDDRPIMACAVERIIQAYLFTSKEGHPALRLHALRLLHEKMAGHLTALGYAELNVFVPPQIESSFSRRLERCFGWKRNWNSWFRRF